MSYRPGLAPVLTGLTFSVPAGSTVGIVGRTGSGKSSLFNALLRLTGGASTALEGGRILVDGVDIATVGVHTLRSRLVVIAQDPVLFSGSLRRNLDPFDERDDAQLWRALQQVGLAAAVLDRVTTGGDGDRSGNGESSRSRSNGSPTSRSGSNAHDVELGMDNNGSSSNHGSSGSSGDGVAAALAMRVEAYGENLSVGQRQLLCIARALVKRDRRRGGNEGGGATGRPMQPLEQPPEPCIVLLDEATASIDRSTDEIIQGVLKRAFMVGNGGASNSNSNSNGGGAVEDAAAAALAAGSSSPCTVLAIAHRIETIIDSDRVLVMSGGRAVEYDAPAALLADESSAFSALCAAHVQGSGGGGAS